ncbi:response regulator transcription factor [Burkholderia ubonensis]|uniref:LuxR family transcriptional regulator n=1 Tax=Burkholderia ubonensis TaxID=101571 RepID=A0AAW3N590_9BURK|nr:response regulator transcription factor [Burkholderia ubonensis]KVT51914.1 LuxR family transcriptional regulator [Burkholderia ubonensis]
MIRTLIADDHAIVRGGIKQILKTTTDIEVVAEATQGSEILHLLCLFSADVALVDMSMPGMAGVDLIRTIRHEYPSLPVLVLSVHNDPQTVSRALRAGATGYLTKDSDPEVLIAAVRKLFRGGRFIDPQLVDAVVFDTTELDPIADDVLSARELHVLKRLVAGKAIIEIAAELSLSSKTISTHKMRLMQKLGIANNAELIRYAIRHDLSFE